MSPGTNLPGEMGKFGFRDRSGQQGALSSPQPQRTAPGAGVGLVGKEGASSWEQGFPVRALTGIQGHSLLLCESNF